MGGGSGAAEALAAGSGATMGGGEATDAGEGSVWARADVASSPLPRADRALRPHHDLSIVIVYRFLNSDALDLRFHIYEWLRCDGIVVNK
jgi:hypothetical protein